MKQESVVGKAVLVYWPLERIRVLTSRNLVHAAPGNAAPAWLGRLGFTLRPLVPSGAVDALPEKMREVCQDIKVFFRDTACAAGRISSNCSS